MKAAVAEGHTLHPLNSTTLREQIADRLRDAILAGHLRPGDRIVERKIAAELGASLTAVREAIVELETEGFIRKRRNATTHITRLSPEETEDALRARAVLEGWAVEEAARRASSERRQELRAAYRAMLEAARSEDRQAFVRRDLEFHRAVWRAAGSATMTAAIERALLPFFAFAAIRIVSVPRANVDLRADAVTHRPMLEAIEAGDVRAARIAFADAMGIWLADTRAHILSVEGTAP